MPQAIGMAIVYATGAAGAAAVNALAATAVALGTTGAALLGHGAIMVAAAGYGAYQKRRAKKAYNASLEDRTQTVRGSEEPRTFVYGTTRVNGLLTYAATHGTDRDKVSMILTLGGHPFDSYIGFMSDDYFIGPTVAPDYWAPAGSVLSRTATDYRTYETATVSTGAGYQIDLTSQIPTGGSLQGVDGVAYRFEYVYGTGEGDPITQSASVTLVPPVQAPDTRTPQWSISGNVITLLSTAAETAGYKLVVSFRVSFVDKHVAKLRWYLGSESDPNLIDSYLISETAALRGPWTSAHLGHEIPRVHCTYTWDETVFANGLPNISAIVKGKKVYDPRQDSTNGGSGSQRADTASTWLWSSNPALCTADYLRAACGATSSEIHWPTVISSANVCDEWVQCQETLTISGITKANPAKVTTSTAHKLVAGQVVWIDAAGMTQIDSDTAGRRTVTAIVSDTEFTVDIDSTGFGTFTSGTCHRDQLRFTCNGILSSEADVKSNLEALLSSMGGMISFSGGLFYINVGAYKAPVLTLDEGDLADGQITLQARSSRADLFNCVRGTFRNPAKLYAIDEFPPYEGTYYITTEDNNEKVFEDFEFPMTDDSVAAQRLAKLALFRSRLSISLEATWKIYAYAVQPGDTVRLKIPRYGWDTIDSNQGKEFRVIDREFVDLSTVRLLLQEEDADVYSWTYGDVVVSQLPPKTNLPRGNQVAPPTNVGLRTDASTFYIQPNGGVIAYAELTWTPPVTTDAFVRVRWKRMIDLEYWKIDTPVGAKSVRLEGLGPNESIKVYLYAINSIGAQSAIVDIATYTTSPDLPVSGEVAPPSANLVPNSTFENGAQRWSFEGIWGGGATGTGRIDPPSYHNAALTIPGPVRNAVCTVSSTYTGNDAAAVWQSEAFAVTPGETMVAFAELHCVGTNAAAGVAFYTTTGAYIGNLFGTLVDKDLDGNAAEWAIPGNYTTSRVRGVVPAGAQVARFTVWATTGWWSNLQKYVSVYQPFAGRVPATATLYPVWTPSGSPIISTPGISKGAITLIRTSVANAAMGIHTYIDNDYLPKISTSGQPFPRYLFTASELEDIPDGADLLVSFAGTVEAQAVTYSYTGTWKPVNADCNIYIIKSDSDYATTPFPYYAYTTGLPNDLVRASNHGYNAMTVAVPRASVEGWDYNNGSPIIRSEYGPQRFGFYVSATFPFRAGYTTGVVIGAVTGGSDPYHQYTLQPGATLRIEVIKR
jgi:hypothetical protein